MSPEKLAEIAERQRIGRRNHRAESEAALRDPTITRKQRTVVIQGLLRASAKIARKRGDYSRYW